MCGKERKKRERTPGKVKGGKSGKGMKRYVEGGAEVKQKGMKLGKKKVKEGKK